MCLLVSKSPDFRWVGILTTNKPGITREQTPRAKVKLTVDGQKYLHIKAGYLANHNVSFSLSTGVKYRICDMCMWRIWGCLESPLLELR